MINPTKPPWMEFKWGTIEKKNPIFIYGIIGTHEKYKKSHSPNFYVKKKKKTFRFDIS